MDQGQRLNKKTHLFFDLDHTLWDYELNSAETLLELYHSYDLQSEGIISKEFLETFVLVNNEVWDKYHLGLVGKDAIRNDRFPAIFNRLHLTIDGKALEMQDEYLAICPTKPHVITGAHEVLSALKSHYQLHIITNGFDEIQGTKLAAGKLDSYFDQTITSGRAGIQKPEPGIFHYALEVTNAIPEQALMIGDNPFTDIEGAFRAGLDQAFFNPTNLPCNITPTIEIKALMELLPILL